MAKKAQGKYKWIDREEAFKLFCLKPDGRHYNAVYDVARILGCSTRVIERMCSLNDWVNRRESIGKNATEKFAEEMQDIAKAEKYKEFQDWNLVEDVVISALATIKKAQQTYLDAPSDEAKLLAWKVLNKLSYDMLNLTTALKTAKNQKRTLLGVPTDITKGELTHDTRGSASLQELQDMAEFIQKNYKAPDKNDTTTTPTNT